MAIKGLAGFLASLVVAGALADSDEAAIDAARRDLAERLMLNIEAITVAPRPAGNFLEAEQLCQRASAPVTRPDIPAAGGESGSEEDAEESEDGGSPGSGSMLILVAEGQQHFYHAWPGEPYHYCELPSTKKRGPIGPPIK